MERDSGFMLCILLIYIFFLIDLAYDMKCVTSNKGRCFCPKSVIA